MLDIRGRCNTKWKLQELPKVAGALNLHAVDYTGLMGGVRNTTGFFNSEVDNMFMCPAVDPSSQLILFTGVGVAACRSENVSWCGDQSRRIV